MYLYDRDSTMTPYILKSVLLCVTVASLVSISIYYLFDFVNTEDPMGFVSIYDVIGSSIISPVLETVIIILLLSVLNNFIENITIKAIIVSLLMSILHSTHVLYWGLITFFSFYVFTVSYLVWCEVSKTKGFVVCTLIHSGLNFISSFTVCLGQYFLEF